MKKKRYKDTGTDTGYFLTFCFLLFVFCSLFFVFGFTTKSNQKTHKPDKKNQKICIKNLKKQESLPILSWLF